MDRHEHVRAELARLARAAAERDEVVAVADQHRAHALFLVDRGRKAAGDGERHVLLARATAAERTWVLAAVPGIDGNDEITAPGR